MTEPPVLGPDVQLLDFQRPVPLDHECPCPAIREAIIPDFKRIDAVAVLVFRRPADMAFLIELLELEHPQHVGTAIHSPALEYVSVEVLVRHVPGAILAPVAPPHLKTKEPAVRDVFEEH